MRDHNWSTEDPGDGCAQCEACGLYRSRPVRAGSPYLYSWTMDTASSGAWVPDLPPCTGSLLAPALNDKD